jgi:hypothetical protein
MDDRSLASLRQDLGEDSLALLDRGPIAITEIQPLHSAEMAERAPHAFRVAYADGQQRKLVRCPRATRARMVAGISRLLDPDRFTPVLACAGTALLTPWVDGTPLHIGGWDEHDVVDGARLLADLHAVTPPPDAPSGATLAMPYRTMLPRHLAILVGAGALSDDERQELCMLIAPYAASEYYVAILHRDLCPENLVRRATGTLCVIDIETLQVGACDYDLARSWNRWPMSPDERRAFFATYVATSGRRPDWRHFPYWALLATASSAAQRLLLRAESAKIPLQRLHALRRELQRGCDGEAVALHG